MLEGAEWQVPDNFSAVVSFEATYVDWIVKEAIEIQLHAKTFKTEAGFILSHTWQLVISFQNALHNQQ